MHDCSIQQRLIFLPILTQSSSWRCLVVNTTTQNEQSSSSLRDAAVVRRPNSPRPISNFQDLLLLDLNSKQSEIEGHRAAIKLATSSSSHASIAVIRKRRERRRGCTKMQPHKTLCLNSDPITALAATTLAGFLGESKHFISSF